MDARRPVTHGDRSSRPNVKRVIRMNNIELICPVCDQLLAIDSGFAGGVCRCYHCGTMMTVPGGLGPQRPKRVTRPDRPETPTPQPQQEQSVLNLPPETVVFKTEDGREVRLAAGQTIPTARAASDGFPLSRRFFTVAVLTLGAIVLAGTLVLTIRSRLPGSAAGPASVKSSGSTRMSDDDPSSRTLRTETQWLAGNPYLGEETQFLGLPLRARVVIAIDASEASKPWLGLVKQAILAGIKAPRMLQVICQRGEFTWMYPSSLGVVEPDEVNDWGSFLADAEPQGDAEPGLLIRRALAGDTDQVILVLGSQIDSTVLESSLRGRQVVQLDIIAIDQDNPQLQELEKRYGGGYRSIETAQLQAWHAETAP